MGIIMITGCSNGQVEKKKASTNDSTQNQTDEIKVNNFSDESEKSFEVNKVVFEDEIVQITCKEITDSSIIFVTKNKTDFEIEWLNMNISLDGCQFSLYANNSLDQKIAAREEREIEYKGELYVAEHKYLGLSGNIFINGSSKGEIDVCNFDLGGNQNEYEINKGKLVYEDDTVAVYYNGLEINNIIFCIYNKLDRAISTGFWGNDSLNINGKIYTSSVTTITGKSAGIYQSYLASSEEDNIQIMHIDSFKGILGVKICLTSASSVMLITETNKSLTS